MNGDDSDDSYVNHLLYLKLAHYHAKECVKHMRRAADDEDFFPNLDPDNPQAEKILQFPYAVARNH